MADIHREFAFKVGCDTKDGLKKAVRCLRSKSRAELIEGSNVIDHCPIMSHRRSGGSFSSGCTKFSHLTMA